MKAIIIAAGRGSRLKELTRDIPKCLLDFDGKTMLQHQLDAFYANGISDISIIGGYKKEKIKVDGAKYYVNDDYKNNNILVSLMYAEKEMDGEFIASYSDIIFEREIVAALLKVEEDIVVVVDTDWKWYYEGRVGHQFDQAEGAIFDEDKNIIDIGKHLDENAPGEFIGMVKCSKEGAKVFREYFHQAKKGFAGKPFVRAAVFEKAYLTDFIKYLVDRSIKVKCALIKRGWYEIDTEYDYKRVNKLLEGKK